MTERIREFLGLNDEQSRILRPGGRIAVRAGAGSGKTRAIIAKYLGILEDSRADVPQIVAVTFTENAASELKSRIRGEIARYIETYGEAGNISGNWKRKFFSAPIGTIHSFCTRMLGENLLDSGLPFRFSVLENREKDLFYAENVGGFLLGKLEEGDPDLERLFEIESWDYGQIAGIVTMILNEAARLHMVPPFVYHGEGEGSRPGPAELESMNERLRNGISEHVSALTARSETRKRNLEDLRGKIDLTRGVEKNARYMKAVYDQIKREFKNDSIERSRLALRNTVFSVMEHYDSEINSLYLRFAGQAYGFLVEAKISGERIEYEDMIRSTIDLLKKNPEILHYYRRFFKFIIVDEFQDTDSLQLELMNLLTDGPSGGSLVLVGDVNQSVYGFRGAQPELFSGILGRDDFERISFATNYRSSASLIGFFNAFFNGTFAPRHYGNMEHPSGEEAGGEPAVEVVSCLGERAGDAVEREAAAVAAKVREIRERSPGEIALLFRRSSNVSVYEKALARAGVRFQSRIGRDFYAISEVRDVLSMLRFLLDPDDSLAEACVLRSPYFGASDDELFSRFRPDEREKVRRIEEYLRFLGEKRKEYAGGDAFRAIDFAVNGLGYSSAVAGLPDGSARRLNLKKLLLVAEDLVSRRGYGLREAVEHMDSLRDAWDEEQAFPESGDGRTVKLMTVHGAKGLEFDTVFICDANYRRVVNTERVMADIERGFIVRYPASSSDGWEELKSLVESREAEEEKRTLYVAMTRAERRLFLCFSGRSYSDRERIRVEKNSFAALLDSKLSLSTRYFGGEDEFSLDGCRIALSREAEGEASGGEAAAAGDVSSLGAEPVADTRYLEPLYEPEDPKSRKVLSRLPDIFSPISRARDPERAGSIMHRFLEVWDFREETVKREADFVLGEFLASNPDMRALLRELSSGFLASELLSMVRGADRVEKELKFVVSSGENGPKRGRIDLLAEYGDGVRLFDYKYRESMNERALEDYGRQMDGYCEAVRSRFEKPLLSRHIVLIPSVELVPI